MPAFLFIVLFASLLSHSQEQNKFTIGITAGPNRSLMHGTSDFTTYHVPAFCYSMGATVQYNFTRSLSLVSGIIYDVKSNTQKLDANLAGIGSRTVRFNYMTVPLLFRLGFGKKIKVFFNAGGFWAFATSVSERFTSDFGVLQFNGSVASQFKRYDAGLIVGAGLGVPMFRHLLFSVEIRDNIGLYTISPADGSLKTNSASLLFSLAYRLKGKSK